ncbi:peptidoglycan editing factor PgeF [uncultured Acetobacteroides sp.]|uniref:peptidoglycan editing factor PgeF n=1 Tax=uncultured Acetobacteroides sp. TaxID=1760811 RepID=UPI0029F56E2C|nr:peptidoglycan editing factor PgeF [uncultured Acetobacteroides sp.]
MIKLTKAPLTYTFNLFANRTDVRTFVTTRIGGEGSEHLATCNIGLSEFEPAAITISNRQKICAALNLDFEKMTFQNQVHSDTITIITSSNAGAGNRVKDQSIPNSDALITETKEITLFAQAADCVPIVLFDTERKVAAAIHAGWRGTVKKIAQQTAEKMIAEFGCNAENILAGIGPSIGHCCYEIGDDVVDAVSSNFPNSTNLLIPYNNRYHLDLWKTNEVQLEEVGIPPRNIEIARLCTKCNPNLFFSSRYNNGKTGRFGIGITIL